MSASDNNFSGGLTSFSLARKITVFVMLLTILVVGLVATLNIPLELVPRGFQPQSLHVRVPWPNAPVEEVIQKITLPLEEELSTVRGLDKINSWSGMGGAGVFLSFKQGTDMSVAYREARDRLHRARALFPSDVDRTFIYKEDTSGIPVGAIGLIIDPSLTDYYDLIQKEVILPLSRIDGVAKVAPDGLEQKEILIELDRAATEANGLNIYQLAQDLGSDNFAMASGTVRDSGKKLLLRSVATYRSLDEIENRQLSQTVKLKDVARIKYEEEEKRYSVRVNSRPAVAIIIWKEGEANTVEVCDRLKAAIEEMSANPRLAGFEMELLFDQGTVIEDSLGNLRKGGLQGAAMAAVILFVFMRRVRLTSIITLSIPLSLLMALVVMFFLGETLNILSLLGLVISVGMLVDNSVVVAENIHRLHSDGLSLREACIRGAAEIALAITLATLTTVVVFVPVALVDGEAQFFMLRLAIPISFALLASLLVAMVFVPLSVYITLPKRNGGNSNGNGLHQRLNRRMEWLYEVTLGKTCRVYGRWLGFFLKHRLDLVLLLVVLLAGSFFVAKKKIKFNPIQEEDQTSFQINVELSAEYNFQDVLDYFAQAEKVMEAKKAEHGLKGYLVVARTGWGRIEGWFDEDAEERPEAKKVGEDVLKALPEKPGVKLFYGRQDQDGDSKNKEMFTVWLEGEDALVLDDIADRIEPVFRNVEGVLGIRQANDPAPSELALIIDRDQTTARSVNPEWLAGIVGNALRGAALPKYKDAGREIPVRVRFQEKDRENLADLANFQVPTTTGEMLPISALTDWQMLNTPRGVFRRSKKVSRAINIEMKADNVEQTRGRLEAIQKTIDLPEGVTFGSIIQDSQNEELKNMQFAGSISILFIFLLMGFLFESFILPLSIILTIPLAALGVIWAHILLGKDIDMLGAIGCVLLIGVVVNNGIVLVDCINRLRLDGLARTQAILHATQVRFRPIMMTALTTIIGTIPLTLSEPSALGLSYKSFGLTLLGGMTAATLLTLLVIPIFYTFFDDARRTMMSLLARSFRAAPEPSSVAEPVQAPSST